MSTSERFELVVTSPAQKRPIARLYQGGTPVARSRVEVAADLIFECAIPWRALDVSTDDPIQFCVELIQDDQAIERVPQEAAIETSVPSPDYELIMWQA